MSTIISIPQDIAAPSVCPELFMDVQVRRIFNDGKSFADAIAKRPAHEIAEAYRRDRPVSDDALRDFVERWFILPQDQDIVAPRPDDQPLIDRIAALWPVLRRPAFVATGSALSLPHPYVVPGGRFREIYYWDSYFTMLGLEEDGLTDLVEGMLFNFVDMIERYGRIPNGSRSYFLSRSQPPFLSLMADMVQTDDADVERRILDALVVEHEFWMAGRHDIGEHQSCCARVVQMPNGVFLNRYWDDCDRPREEMLADDVLLAADSGRDAPTLYRHIRAAAESGWDFSSRWFAQADDLSTIRTTEIVPVDLNSLLWRLESSIADRSAALGLIDQAHVFALAAKVRKETMNRYLWSDALGRFVDFDMVSIAPTNCISAATLYPLFVGLAEPEQARQAARLAHDRLLAPGGLRTTTVNSGEQWDIPNGWAPLQWIAAAGLIQYGESDLAHDIAMRWIATVDHEYRATGRIFEKYDIEHIAAGMGGEYPIQDGFGWTNGVTRKFLAWQAQQSDVSAT